MTGVQTCALPISMMLLTADAQVYSHVFDFSWADENRKHQTDWRLFSKEKY